MHETQLLIAILIIIWRVVQYAVHTLNWYRSRSIILHSLLKLSTGTIPGTRYCVIQHGGSCRKEVSKGGLAVVTRKTE